MARKSRVSRPHPRHLRGTISSKLVGTRVSEGFDAELADGGFEDDDPLLQCGDRAGVQAELEVFFVDPVVDRCDAV